LIVIFSRIWRQGTIINGSYSIFARELIYLKAIRRYPRQAATVRRRYRKVNVEIIKAMVRRSADDGSIHVVTSKRRSLWNI
jgi:hypothetical protein